jgi:hypothetical protein
VSLARDAGRHQLAGVAIVRRALLGAMVAAVATAAAGPAARADPARQRPHALYLELLGKGALYGVGYDGQPSPWWSAGATASFFVVRGESVATLSPYLGFYPLGHGRHRAVVHLGALLARRWTPSSVPELPDRVESGVAGELAAGYELRGPLLARVMGLATIGRGGLHPWLGVSLGWAF